MLIPINIHPPSDSNPKLPPTLAKISHDQVVLIELQGRLEIEDEGSHAHRDGQLIATFTIDDAGKKATLMIGSHLLEGNIVSLPKPLAILHHSHSSSTALQTDLHATDSDSDTNSPTSKRIRLQTTDSQESDSQSQSQSGQNLHISTTSEAQAPLPSSSSSSSFSTRPSRSDPTTNINTDPRTVSIPPTWNMIAIVKKKIVFSKRPMPIFHKP